MTIYDIDILNLVNLMEKNKSDNILVRFCVFACMCGMCVCVCVVWCVQEREYYY